MHLNVDVSVLIDELFDDLLEDVAVVGLRQLQGCRVEDGDAGLVNLRSDPEAKYFNTRL
jgi:hypothetical protein